MGVVAAAVVVPRFLRGPEGVFFDSAGVSIHYTDEGSGEPVILVHGFAANGHVNWRLTGVVEELSRDLRVVTMDARGHGRSGAPSSPGAYGVEMADDVVRLMDHLEIPRAHVAGYSMGAFITLRLLTRHPDRILRAAPCGFGWQRPDPSALNVYDTLASAFEHGFGFSVLTAFLNPGSSGGPLRASLADLAAAAFVDEGALSTVVRSFPELTVTEAQLRAVDVPVLSIIGSDDPLKPGVDAMVGVLPRHEVVVVAGGTHRFTPRDPLFREALHRFLRGEPAALAAR